MCLIVTQSASLNRENKKILNFVIFCEIQTPSYASGNAKEDSFSADLHSPAPGSQYFQRMPSTDPHTPVLHCAQAGLIKFIRPVRASVDTIVSPDCETLPCDASCHR